MDIARKLELAEQHIRSISQHDDADMAIRAAALDRLVQRIDAERASMAERVQRRIEDALRSPATQQ